MMKAAVLALFLLIVAVAESQDYVAPVPIDPAIPGAGRSCELSSKSRFVTKGCCTGYITVGYCSGLCSSSSEYTSNLAKAKCTCCRDTRMIQRTAKLDCSEGLVADYTYSTIAACRCLDTSCSLQPVPDDASAQ